MTVQPTELFPAAAAAAAGERRVVVARERERKFLVSPPRAESLAAAIARHAQPVIHDRARPVAWTRTTYLDTDDLAYLRSSADGRTSRRIRVREYATARDTADEPRLTGACFLELKETRRAARVKRRIPAAAKEISALLAGSTAVAEVLAIAAPALVRRILHDAPRARACTWYRREAFVSDDGAVRISIDHGLAFGEAPEFGPAGDPATPSRLLERVDIRVVEVKAPGPEPAWLAPLLEDLEEARGFSKFRLAMAALGAQGTRR